MRILCYIVLFSCFGTVGHGQSGNLSDSIPFPQDTVQTQIVTHDSTKDKVADSSQNVASKDQKIPKPPFMHQFRLGVDVSRAVFNLLYPSRQAYGIQADYALRKEVYLVAEAGLGRGKIDYDNLKYTTNGYFFRIGLNKSFLDRVGAKDFDIGFLGFRYGMGIGRRNQATFIVSSPFGPGTPGSAPGQNFMVHWGELVGGLKVELWKGLFMGWTVRGKFLFNPGEFKELAPNFIPGYGKGDHKSVFDFNLYLSYAIRWKKE